MNNIWRRIGGVVVIIISLLVLLSSLGGAIGLWFVNGAMHDVTAAVFSPIQTGLDTANTSLSNVNTHVTNARTRISNAQQSAAQLGQNVGNGAFLGAISDTIATNLQPQIEQAQESISNTVDFISGVNQSIVAVNKLPSVDLPTVTDVLAPVRARAAAMGAKMQALRSGLQDMVQGRLQITAARLNSLLTDLDSALQNIQSSVNDFGAKVQQTQAKLNDLQGNINTWITVGWVVATIFLLWIAISQVAMLMFGWSLLRSKPKDLAAPDAPAAGETVTSPATT